MTKKVSEIYFVRHAESTINMEGVFAYQKNHRLTVPGGRQAQKLLKIFKKDKFDLIVVSNYERTQLTALPLLKKHKKDFVVWPMQEFTMFNKKRYTEQVLADRQTLGIAYWQKCDPKHRDGRGTENYLDLIKRIDLSRKIILKKKFNKILVFTHGNFLRHFIWRNFYPNVKINHETMTSAARVGWGLSIDNTEIIKAIKVDNKIYFGEFDSKHVRH